MNDDKVQIELSKDEALVLFEFLSRYSETKTLEIEDQSEEKALWRLTGVLEKILVEPFLPDYKKILKDSRDKLRNE